MLLLIFSILFYVPSIIISPHRMLSLHKMRPIATGGVAWFVCLSVGHTRESCNNG